MAVTRWIDFFYDRSRASFTVVTFFFMAPSNTMKYDEIYLPYCKGLVDQVLDEHLDDQPIEDDTPQACCGGMIAKCRACHEGMTTEDFCRQNPGYQGCPDWSSDICGNLPCAKKYREHNILTNADFVDKCTSSGGTVTVAPRGGQQVQLCSTSLGIPFDPTAPCNYWSRAFDECVPGTN